MLAVIFTTIGLLYTLLWIRAMRRMYKTIRASEDFTEQEKAVLTRQIIVLSPAITSFILIMGMWSYPYLAFFDSEAVFNVIILIVAPILLFIGITAIKYRVAPSREPVRGNAAILAGVIAIGGVLSLIYIILSLNFF
jgi:hypothetical protein